MKEILFNINLDTIERVDYGADIRRIDVTSIFKSEIENYKKIIISNNTFKNDPAFQTKKDIHIHLNDCNVLIYNEHEILSTEIDENIVKMMNIRAKIEMQEDYYNELKVNYIAELINKSDAKTFVEIGVYQGAVLFPISAYLNSDRAKCYGIDSYSEYTQEDTNYPVKYGTITNYLLTHSELNKIYEEALEFIKTNELTCILIRKNSEIASTSFEDNSIDILHIDASYLYLNVKRDIDLYFPKLQHGGYIIFNCTNRESVYKAYKEFITLYKKSIRVIRKTWEWICIQKV